jgi:DNA-binding MurR/RpiR family transcriptional regulator
MKVVKKKLIITDNKLLTPAPNKVQQAAELIRVAKSVYCIGIMLSKLIGVKASNIKF